MKTYALYALALLVPGGVIVALIYRWHKRRVWLDAPNYVTAIEALKPEKPMDLPAIRPLKARPMGAALRVVGR